MLPARESLRRRTHIPFLQAEKQIIVKCVRRLLEGPRSLVVMEEQGGFGTDDPGPVRRGIGDLHVLGHRVGRRRTITDRHVVLDQVNVPGAKTGIQRGEPFEYRGRTVRITPKPTTPGGPALLMGGNSKAAARRAARFDMGMIAQGMNPELESIYREECERLGKPPGMCINPPMGTVTSAFVSEDPDRAWGEIGPHMLHDAMAYAAWLGDSASITKSVAKSVEELRAQKGAYQIFTPDEAKAYIAQFGVLLLQPLCGGLPPDLAWESLELMASDAIVGISSRHVFTSTSETRPRTAAASSPSSCSPERRRMI